MTNNQLMRQKTAKANQVRQRSGELLDVRQAALLLGLSEHTVRGRIRRRQLPFVRLGGRVLFRRQDLLSYLDSLAGCTPDEALKN